MSVFLCPSEPSVSSVRACRWRFMSEATRAAAVHGLKLQSPDPAVQLFEDAEEPALLATIWGLGLSRARYRPSGRPPWPPGQRSNGWLTQS
jgi:hypothetical protein